MAFNKHKNKLSKWQVERLSRNNVKKMLTKTDKLKSWGHSGYTKIQRLNKWFHYRSSIELNVIQELDKADDYIVDFDSECFYVPYEFRGATLNYIPDFILKTSNGNTFVIEVKPKAQLKEEKNIAKWKEAKRWCWEQGCRFIVITEKDYPDMIQILKHLEDKEIEQAQSLMEWKL